MNVDGVQALQSSLQQVCVRHHCANANPIEEFSLENSVMRIQYRKHVRSLKGSALRPDCSNSSEKIFAVNLKTHSWVLGYFEALLANELVEHPLDPLRGGPGSLDNSLLVNADSVHYKNNSSIVHDSDHPGKDPLKSLSQTLEIERFLET